MNRNIFKKFLKEKAQQLSLVCGFYKAALTILKTQESTLDS